MMTLASMTREWTGFVVVEVAAGAVVAGAGFCWLCAVGSATAGASILAAVRMTTGIVILLSGLKWPKRSDASIRQ